MRQVSLFPLLAAEGASDAPEPSAETAPENEGWSIESNSASARAPQEADLDDTAGVDSRSAPPSTQEGSRSLPRPAGEDDEPGAVADTDEDASDEPPLAAAAAEDDAATPKKKLPAGVLKRQAAIDEGIRERTKRLKALERQIADQERRLAETSTPPPAAPSRAAPPTAAPNTATAATAGPPTHPNYAEFDTDEDYTAAVQKWASDTTAWQTSREEALASRLTEGFENRLAREQEAAAVSGAREALSRRMASMADRHPDYQEKLAAVKKSGAWADFNDNHFLQDVSANTEFGPELLYTLLDDPSLGAALAALPPPSQELRDAVVSSSAGEQIMAHFATGEGAKDFMALRQMPPDRVYRAIGALEARLATAPVQPGGPAADAPSRITKAAAPSKPPGGPAPGATGRGGGSPLDDPNIPLDEAIAQENAREARENLAALGLR